jgi:hypothetical protein
MAHFAILDDDNVVTSVVVIDNKDCEDTDGNELESVGKTFCTNLFGAGNYVQTSYNGTFRQTMAFVGGTYDATKDKFIAPQPFASWTLNSNSIWVAPLSKPSDAFDNGGVNTYLWDEDAYQSDNTQGWKQFG